ncbi:MAG: DNA mismatch repair endonuclease MutL [Acutalibacteraceae bacterium]|nr:DNA mismatch repair endonuclease MutL [Acutalibacteraceae bacterium]
MGRINVLDKNTAELIAAGEVVERPASVVKELLENCIDAKSTAITIEIKNGGVKYIRITDNGTGILKEDVPKAFLRHATSKVATAIDLDKIATLGFRGEALASVCAVAKVQLITKHTDDEIGTQYEIQAGEEVSYNDAGCPQGTTIIVRDLFYNIPARMKFLKKDVTEGNAIANIIDKLALSHSEIAFTFIRDGKQVLKTSGDGNLKSAIYSVYGKEFVSKLIPVDYSLNGVQVKGYISKPEFARPNRNMQNFFINGRFIKSLTTAKALEEAFKGSIMVGKMPSCVLNIAIPFETVDVNVHPAKTEVRFINERPIFDAVYHGVKTALLKGDTAKVISLKPADNIPHKQPKPFTFENTPYSVKPQQSEQLTFIGSALGKQEREDTQNINNSNKVTINTDKKIDTSTFDTKVKESTDVINDEPKLFIPKAKPFVKTESLLNTSVVHDSKTENSYLGNKASKSQVTKTINALNTLNSVEIPNNETLLTEKTIEEDVLSVSTSNTEETTKTTSAISEISTNVEEQSVNNYESTNNNNQKNNIEDIFDCDNQLKYLGEAFATYIIVQKGKDKIMFIDKHAAHERIIYEKLKKEKGKGYMQCLLAPIVVTLPKDEYNALIENTQLLAEYNFDINDFGNGKVAVRGVPQYVDNCNVEDMITEIANNLLEKKIDINTEQMDWIYHSISCRSAIKAGNINYEQELMEIAKIVDNNESIRYCPHGRPVCFVLTKYELEKQFGRV